VAYTPGTHAGGLGVLRFSRRPKDFAQRSRNRLTFPVIVIGGEKANGVVLGQQLQLVASNVTVIVLKDTGHWVLEERPKETTDALVKLL
jgi:pimeloyl-ACP methyl ester carboxylesterase